MTTPLAKDSEPPQERAIRRLGSPARWRECAAVISWVAMFHPCVGVPEEAVAYSDFAEGVYASNSFRYPSGLTIEEVRGMVAEIESRSRFEILDIRYVYSTDDQSYDTDQLEVSTCTHGIRQAFFCDGGEAFRFHKRDGKWTLSSTRPLHWIQ